VVFNRSRPERSRITGQGGEGSGVQVTEVARKRDAFVASPVMSPPNRFD
jgi:flagellar hook-associated protein FlgK